jgi:hypothetical protein
VERLGGLPDQEAGIWMDFTMENIRDQLETSCRKKKMNEKRKKKTQMDE